MHIPFHSIILMLVTFSCFLSQGCMGFLRPRRPIEVTVLDHKTGKPIANADVEVHYLGLQFLGPPPASEDETDSVGKATVWAGNPRNYFRWCEVRAEGYLTYKGWTKEFKNLLHNLGKKRVATIELYRAPAPEITIPIPAEHRGPVVLHWDKKNALSKVPEDQRAFTFQPDERGYVQMPATPLLLHYASTKFVWAETRAPLAEEHTVEDQDVTARLVARTDLGDVWIVGTSKEAEDLENSFRSPFVKLPAELLVKMHVLTLANQAAQTISRQPQQRAK